MVYIVEQCGTEYAEIDPETGNVRRLDIPGFQPSGKWQIIGVHEAKPFGRMGPRQTFQAAANGELGPWQFKNGSQRLYITDFDHGAERMWMSPTPYRIFERD